jgi:glucose-1-phosphate cytidylyltransferase
MGDFSEGLPKPMVPVGGRPLLWHIMKYYAHYGHRDFVLCLGYRAGVIEDYFRRREFREAGWNISFVDTGLDSSIGQRFAAVRDYVVDDEVFLTTYGDTVTDAPLPLLIAARAANGKVASLLSVQPNYTFNAVASDERGLVTSFHDIAQTGIRVNGGYFVFHRDVFEYLREGDDLPDTLRRVIEDEQLFAFRYDGFWAPMDTLKDKERLEGLVQSGGSVWQVWAYAAGEAAGASA